MAIKQAIEESSLYLMDTYKRFPVLLRKGRGIRVWSSEGKEYLDFVGGIAVNLLGHCHPKVVMSIQKQAQRLIHVSNLYHIEQQTKLAALLCANSFADKVFFCNSGTEAVEAAIKLARKYAREQIGPERFEIVAAINSFHGRTLGALSASGQDKFKKGFEPLLPGFVHVPYDDAEAIEKAVTHNTCAVLLEPIQGEAGVRVPSPDYLKKVRRICDEQGILLILDEIQTGMGRTGELFGYQHGGIEPDIMTLAKGLANGMPIGAMLATEKVAKAFGPGDHGSTFGGNPLACAAALTTLETILEDGLVLDQCRRMGKYLMKKLEYLKKEFSSVVLEVRGTGLLVGVEITRECAPIVTACLERGLLINCTAGNVIRLMPPLIVEPEDIDSMALTLEQVFERLS
ncbi:MAG: acetylornithine transaminase [Nitrospirota bacterium]|jgi:predicted acetylornithine/succinylornithine family transaminase